MYKKLFSLVLIAIITIIAIGACAATTPMTDIKIGSDISCKSVCDQYSDVWFAINTETKTYLGTGEVLPLTAVDNWRNGNVVKRLMTEEIGCYFSHGTNGVDHPYVEVNSSEKICSITIFTKRNSAPTDNWIARTYNIYGLPFVLIDTTRHTSYWSTTLYTESGNKLDPNWGEYVTAQESRVYK